MKTDALDTTALGTSDPDRIGLLGARITRAFGPLVVAVIIFATQWVSALFDEPPGLSFCLVLSVVGLAVSEALRLHSRWLDRRLPWPSHTGRRLAAQIGGAVFIAALLVFAVYLPTKQYQIMHGSHDTIAWPHLASTGLVALAMALGLSALHIALDFYAGWQRTQLSAKRMQSLVLRAELDALKAQINPHFLFNSLNTVHGLIAQDPEAARALVIELSDVLRYALGHSDRDLVPLARELAFLEAYRALLQARHGRGLRIEIEPMDDAERWRIPPMSLQLLVENAVRHNRTREDDPLRVRVRRVGDRIVVSNPVMARYRANPGAGTGLSNIDQRYRLMGAEGVRILREDGLFSVALALFPPASAGAAP